MAGWHRLWLLQLVPLDQLSCHLQGTVARQSATMTKTVTSGVWLWKPVHATAHRPSPAPTAFSRPGLLFLAGTARAWWWSSAFAIRCSAADLNVLCILPVPQCLTPRFRDCAAQRGVSQRFAPRTSLCWQPFQRSFKKPSVQSTSSHLLDVLLPASPASPPCQLAERLYASHQSCTYQASPCRGRAARSRR